MLDVLFSVDLDNSSKDLDISFLLIQRCNRDGPELNLFGFGIIFFAEWTEKGF